MTKVLTEADAAADLAGLPRPVSSEQALQKIDKAWRVVTSLCDGTQDWTMNVPARPDSDPDLVIGDALRLARTLASERDALRAENESLMRGLRGKHALTGATYEHLVSERDALAGRVAELEAARDAAAGTACKALLRAWHLGQTYWSQADSESYSQNRRAEETHAKFVALVDEARAALSATTPESKP